MPDPSALTSRLLDILEIPYAQRGEIGFTGICAMLDDEARYDVASFAAACVATAHTVASATQNVHVNVFEAAEAFKSERHLSIDGRAPASLWASLSSNYRDRNDRWLRIHGNFPHHARAAANGLDAEPAPDSFREAIRHGDAFDLEERVIAAGGAAATLRTQDEWTRHPQQKHLATQPLVVFQRLTEARPVERTRPLRVLELTRVIAGPVAGRVLALHGADVLAVTAPSLPQVDALVVDMGFGKRSTFLDLRHVHQAAVFRDLVATADVLLESYRPGALAGLGFGAEACVQLNPNLTYVSISAYGDGGPWGGRRGFDSLVQMVTGIASNGTAFSTPRPLPAQALDHGTGWLAAAAALAAVERSRRLGGAWLVTLSLARTALALASVGPPAPSDGTLPREGAREAMLASDFGTLRYLSPPGRIGGQPVAYAHAPHVLGSDSPTWR